jgi:hypothetical protein
MNIAMTARRRLTDSRFGILQEILASQKGPGSLLMYRNIFRIATFDSGRGFREVFSNAG